MDRWTARTEFFACGLFVLPLELGLGLDSFTAFAVTLALMQILLIVASLCAPTVGPAEHRDQRKH